MKDKNCELCAGSGWYGDNGPGIKGNREYVPCERCNPRGEEATPDSKSDRALLEEAVILIRQYHDMMPTPESIEFLARAAEVDKEGR
jgi:methylphosphotriester-DNA--protein-cysteine methyltransferase